MYNYYVITQKVNFHNEFNLLYIYGIRFMEYDCHIFSKYLAFQMKNLKFQSKLEISKY